MPDQAEQDTRPGLAIVANVAAPYRINLHRRIAQGVPELRLHSLFTHGAGAFRWEVDLPPEIHATSFAVHDEGPQSRTWKHPWRDWRKGGRILRYLHEHDVKAVICHGYMYITNLRVIWHCHRAGIPVFLRGDSNARCDRPRTPLHAWLKRLLLGAVIRHTDGVMPVGTLGQQYFEKYGADGRRSFWVTFEPDYSFFADAPAEAVEGFRALHRLAADRRYLLFSGRLAPVKRVDLLIDAFAAVADRRPEWDLLIAGDGPLREQLVARVPKRLAARVVWLGFLEVEAMRLAYHAAHVMVLPSDYEPWALVVNEAMAAGCPVVASDIVGAAWDLVTDGTSGRLFASGHVRSLTAALLDVTDRKSYRRYRKATAEALASWRRRADPVKGVRAALQSVGVLGPAGIEP